MTEILCPDCGHEMNMHSQTLDGDGYCYENDMKCKCGKSPFEILRHEFDQLTSENEQLRAALEGLMKFHPDDELGETCEEYWSPEYSAAIQAVRAALEATK